MGAQKNRPIGTVLLSTHNVCFGCEIRKVIFSYALLSKGLLWHNVVFVFLPGSSFNEGIEATFKDRQMEDLWIPFFTVSTDLTSSQMRVHTHGMYTVPQLLSSADNLCKHFEPRPGLIVVLKEYFEKVNFENSHMGEVFRIIR